jgi:hypothetical protein
VRTGIFELLLLIHDANQSVSGQATVAIIQLAAICVFSAIGRLWVGGGHGSGQASAVHLPFSHDRFCTVPPPERVNKLQLLILELHPRHDVCGNSDYRALHWRQNASPMRPSAV